MNVFNDQFIMVADTAENETWASVDTVENSTTKADSVNILMSYPMTIQKLLIHLQLWLKL